MPPSTSALSMTMRHKIGILLSRRGRLQLVGATIGSILVSLAETTAVLFLVPLTQLLTGSPIDQGVLGYISHPLGITSKDTLAAILVAAVLSGFIFKDLMTIAFRWWMLGFINLQQAETSTRLLDYYVRAPYSFHLHHSTSDLLQRMGTAVSLVYSRFVMGFVSAATEAITIGAMMIALLVVQPLPTLGVIVYFGVASLLLSHIIKDRAIQAGQRQIDAAARGGVASFEAIWGVKEIQIRHSSDHFVRVAAEANRSSALAGRVAGFLGEFPKYLLEVLFIVGLGLVIVLAGSRGSSAEVLGALALLTAASFRILPSISRLLASAASIRVGSPALDEVAHDLTAAVKLAPLRDRPIPPMPFHDHLVLDAVTFRYGPGSPLVLHDVSLRVPFGTSLALVGNSGAGKTTLADLVLGLHKPTSGQILVDGVDIRSDLAGWQKNVAVVPQDVFLMDKSLRENVAFDQDIDQIDNNEIMRALSRAQLAEFVAELPNGLDTEVGERGARLSGGQRQRIGIARALYRDPQLLILDEATSALDNETERHITETIHSLRGRITILVIAHRLSTVRDADTLAYLVRGRVAACGDFESVRQSNSDFAHLVELGSLTRDYTDSRTEAIS